MPLYPSLEDMNVHQMVKAQQRAEPTHPPAPLPYALNPSPNHGYPAVMPSAPIAPGSHAAASAPAGMSLYPTLDDDYMGFDLKALRQVAVRPEVPVVPTQSTPAPAPNSLAQYVAPLSGNSAGLIRAHVTHGIREVVVCKNSEGKIGLKARAISNGVFVQLVEKDSPAALVGIRFGDQILQIDGENVAGYSMEKTHKIFKNCAANGIRIAIRDRPFERTVTLHKSSDGFVGFQFKDGQIITIVKDSSAARNGLLTDHHLLEVNGQNVVGIKDKDITKIIQAAGSIITVTIMPSVLYTHIMKQMAFSLIKSSMDHGIRDF